MILHLRAAGSSLVLDVPVQDGGGLPAVLHWGRDLGPLDDDALAALAAALVPAVPPSAVDTPLRLSVLPTREQGWTGRPGVEGFWSGTGAPAAPLVPVGADRVGERAVRLTADAGPVRVTTDLELTEHGVLRVRHAAENRGDDTFVLGALDATLPVPDRAREVLDFTGLWAHERRPQRTVLGHGAWTRETRHGRPGHDDPFLVVAGTPGFGFGTGEVWATHVAWSGDKRQWAERQALGRAVLGGGELLAPGEVRLAPGERYTAPWLVAAWSGTGLDGLSDRFHPWVRSWATGRRPRRVVLNTWEAVYFDHDRATLDRLVDVAAEVGVERFVLDDGWFTGRTDATRALGDWTVDADAWPAGLHPLVERVHARGMDLGLWVEPEMVSPDSDLARAHPEWVVGGGRLPTWRDQWTLDLGHPDAYAHVRDALVALLEEYPVASLKWDHNRDLLHGSAHRQTTALYRLLDELRARFPALEIESCASGGARIDLGILPRVDRVWTSDTNDPLERQTIQRWTGVLVPPEYLGGHLGAPRAHTTGRVASTAFRCATALLGSAGIEWDLTRASADEIVEVRAWVADHVARRGLLHTGRVVRVDGADPAVLVHGVVAHDQREALFAVVALASAEAALPAPVRLAGLDPQQAYRVRTVGASPLQIQAAPPPWLAAGGTTLPGRVLLDVGLAAPLLAPQNALLLAVEAVDADDAARFTP
ncbi:alpha-galactosidase [Cellulomonas phragmiteti]|uniref:alpha-galactosidase n=1 Tax=Cellulomonas phragmiteti TaxID=478780 RepID=A0ABQ4DLK9_9CELL|nr:alpha-galactosidase [Cellulomonas phragmiteti]GIG40229.1 alpha-galactosidase [Cellulomonas phragmiteti]